MLKINAELLACYCGCLQVIVIEIKPGWAQTVCAKCKTGLAAAYRIKK